MQTTRIGKLWKLDRIWLFALFFVCAMSFLSTDALCAMRVSDNGRFLVRDDGTPFFWLGDTAWALCHAQDRADAAHYLDVRASQGFTVIQIPAVMSRYIDRPNAYGDKPFTNKDLSQPDTRPGSNPQDPSQYDYWDHVDYVIDAAAARGLTVGLLPFFVAFGPGWDYLSTDNADSYARFIGKRFGKKPNVIWILGGDDRADTETKRIVWDAVAKAIAQTAVGSEDYSELLMTYHSPGVTSSSDWLHNKPWLDFNMIQTWASYNKIYDRVTHDYKLSPVKPTGLGEGAYENGPEYPTKPITPLVIRRQAYWSYLAGGYFTYGNTSIWNFGIQEEAYFVKKPWKDALTDPGALHMSVAARFFPSISWWRLVPDQSVFASGAVSSAMQNAALRSEDGGRVVVYLASSTTVKIKMDKLSGEPVRATWVDPKTGVCTSAGQYTNSGKQSFSTPRTWEDALLLLESTD
jgi:Protein of unknown function (DUF4038)/Putative collagen-binding domain of a collagenase